MFQFQHLICLCSIVNKIWVRVRRLLCNLQIVSILCFNLYFTHGPNFLGFGVVNDQTFSYSVVTVIMYLRLGLKSTYSSACVELLAVEIKLKSRKTRSGTPSSWVSCLWIICSLNDICCCVFLRNRYQPMTFYKIVKQKHYLKGNKSYKACSHL